MHYKVTKPSKQLDSFNKSMQEKQGNEHIWCTEQPNLALTLCVVKSRLHSSQKQSLLSATLSMSIENVINHNAIPHKVSPHGHLATLCTRLRVTWHVNGNSHNNLATKQSCFSIVLNRRVLKSFELCCYVEAKCVVWQKRLCEPEAEISLPGVEEIRRNSFTPW